MSTSVPFASKTTALELAYALAASDPLRFDPRDDGLRCVHCGVAAVREDAAAVNRQSVAYSYTARHAPGCLWARARSWVLSLGGKR